MPERVLLRHIVVTVAATSTFAVAVKFALSSRACDAAAAAGDIYAILQKRRSQLLSEETILDWFVQMCLGLKHVHDRKILHR